MEDGMINKNDERTTKGFAVSEALHQYIKDNLHDPPIEYCSVFREWVAHNYIEDSESEYTGNSADEASIVSEEAHLLSCNALAKDQDYFNAEEEKRNHKDEYGRINSPVKNFNEDKTSNSNMMMPVVCENRENFPQVQNSNHFDHDQINALKVKSVASGEVMCLKNKLKSESGQFKNESFSSKVSEPMLSSELSSNVLAKYGSNNKNIQVENPHLLHAHILAINMDQSDLSSKK